MKITKGREVFGGKAAGQANIDGAMRSAYTSGGNAVGALAKGTYRAAEELIGLERAEEHAKANELQAQYQVEYDEKVAQLDDMHKQSNFAASEYAQRHQQIVDDLYGKYSQAHDWNTDFGDKYNSFLDVDKERKRVGIAPKVTDIAMQNQAISWQKGEQNRSNAAIGGDYQNLQNQITEQSSIYDSAPYLVAHGENAIVNKQSFIDNSSEQWMERQILGGADPREMLVNVQTGSLFGNVSEEVRTEMAVSLHAEIKRRDKEAAKRAKEMAKVKAANQAAMDLQTSGAMDPKSKEHKAAFNTLIAQAGQTATSPLEAEQARVNLRIRYGYIEPAEKSSVVAAFNSGDEQAMQIAIQKVNHYASKNKRLMSTFPKEMQEAANLVATGYSAVQAMEMSKQLQNLPEQRIKELRIATKDDGFVKDSVEDLVEEIEADWGVDSTMGFGGWDRPDEFTERANEIFKQQYVHYNGNVEAAQKATAQQLAASWGTTNIGGENKFMMKPPSSFIRSADTQVEPDQIKEIFLDELEGVGIPREKGAKAEIMFHDLDKDKNPRYVVLFDGQPYEDDTTGKARYWTFDVGTATKVIKEVELEKRAEETNKAREVLSGQLAEGKSTRASRRKRTAERAKARKDLEENNPKPTGRQTRRGLRR